MELLMIRFYRLSHAKSNVLRTNMWSIFLSTDGIVSKDKDKIKRETNIRGDKSSYQQMTL
jgi:hypothetical protein